MTFSHNETTIPLTLPEILAHGLPAFYSWIRAQARKAEPVIFQEGHLAANPVACYINAQIGDLSCPTHLYEGVIYTAAGAQTLPEDFQRFLWDMHAAFEKQYVTAGVLAEWVAQGKPKPPHPDDLTDHYHQLHEEICRNLGHAASLVRESFLDPNQPSYEECLGIALAKFCSWEGRRIARTCLRLCYAALEDANYATLGRLLREHFGEETFS